MAKNYKQGKFHPKNPEKYLGDYKNIVSRSSWETRVFNWCDTSSYILNWSSEEIIVQYISPVDNRPHRYFPDVMIKVKGNSGIKTYLIEVKPNKEIIAPVRGNKRKLTYLNEVATYAVNQAKWAAANRYCNDRGWEFKVVDEYDLGLSKRK